MLVLPGAGGAVPWTDAEPEREMGEIKWFHQRIHGPLWTGRTHCELGQLSTALKCI